LAAYGDRREWRNPPDEAVNRRGVYVRPDLVDRLIELYCDWRTACAEVQAAYDRFSDAPALERAVAFAAYEAALDREESACEFYASQIRLVEARCVDTALPARQRQSHHS
jgi:hypothetical protein